MKEIVERVKQAQAERRPLRIRGAGTWLDAGRPADGDTLSLAEHRGIIEYVPGDLTLTARAGTPLADIVSATKDHGQWLPLDPWGGDEGTLGATISTATGGPHAASMGMPRDVVLGLEFVTGAGAVVRSGGRVVKNVAGFDLTRLLVGSWGTLGVITEATVRLRARPQHTRSVLMDAPGTPAALNDLVVKLRALPFVPLAGEIVSGSLASRLGAGSRDALLFRLGGNAKALQGQLDLLGGIASYRDLAEDTWPKLREADRGLQGAWRWSQLPARFGDLWYAAARGSHGLEGAVMHGNPIRGVLRVLANGPDAALARAACGTEGSVVIERMPPKAWQHCAPGTTEDALSRAIRAKFDPSGILNAGILGEARSP